MNCNIMKVRRSQIHTKTETAEQTKAAAFLSIRLPVCLCGSVCCSASFRWERTGKAGVLSRPVRVGGISPAQKNISVRFGLNKPGRKH